MIPNETHTAAALYNLTMLEELEDNEYLAEVINIFLEEAPVELKEMKQAATGGNNDMIAKKAHKLKGSAGVIQADKLIESLTSLEFNAKSGAAINELQNLVDKTKQIYSNIEYALQQYLKTLAT
jgi:HPt (histidine-containing phosphotransfer) domain-containing protein